MGKITKAQWAEANSRRGELIRKCHTGLTEVEQKEFENLQAMADEYIRQEAPLPLEELKELERRLLESGKVYKCACCGAIAGEWDVQFAGESPVCSDKCYQSIAKATRLRILNRLASKQSRAKEAEHG